MNMFPSAWLFMWLVVTKGWQQTCSKMLFLLFNLILLNVHKEHELQHQHKIAFCPCNTAQVFEIIITMLSIITKLVVSQL